MRERVIPVVTQAIDVYAGEPETLVLAHGAILSLMLPFVFGNVTPTFTISNVLANMASSATPSTVTTWSVPTGPASSRRRPDDRGPPTERTG